MINSSECLLSFFILPSFATLDKTKEKEKAMPSIDGGSSSSEEYAPHMYMKGADGSSVFIGRDAVDMYDKSDSSYWVIAPLEEGKFIVNKRVAVDTFQWDKHYTTLGEITPPIALKMLDRIFRQPEDIRKSLIIELAARLEPPVILAESDIPDYTEDFAAHFSGDQERIDEQDRVHREYIIGIKALRDVVIGVTE